MEPSFWGDVPEDTGVCYNNRRELSAALRRLLAREQQQRLLVFESSSPGIQDSVITHLAWLLAGVADVPLNVCWFIAYPHSEFRDLGLAFRRFLLGLWRRKAFTNARMNEYLALSFELQDTDNANDYYAVNISTLATKVGLEDVLVVLDYQHCSSLDLWQKTRPIVDRFLAAPAIGLRRGLIVSTPGSSAHPADFRLVGPSDAPSVPSVSKKRRPRSPKPAFRGEDFIRDAAKVVHALIRLNQPAQERVLQYIAHHHEGMPSSPDEYVNLGLIKPLTEGRFQVSATSIDSAALTPTRSLGVFSDTVPNGAKVLSFQPPGRFLAQETGLRELTPSATNATILVDLFALAVNQKRTGDPRAIDTLRELIKSAHQKVVLNSSENHARQLLRYSSQLLLTRPEAFAGPFFPFFEALSSGYADFLHTRYTEDEKIVEASRALTNVGFVFDQIAPLVRTRLFSEKTRAGIFNQAAAYLSALLPRDISRWAQIRYLEGWQLWDGGQKDQSIEIFREGARILGRVAAEEFPADQDLKIMSQEFLMIFLAFASADVVPDDLKQQLAEMCADYGSTLQLEDILHGNAKGKVLIDSTNVNRFINSDVTIICCYPDFHIGLLASQALRRNYNRVPRVVVFPINVSPIVPVEAYCEGDLTLIIGSPDTPGAIGRLVSSLDLGLVRVFQLNLAENFGAATINILNTHAVHLLSGCGLLGNVQAWRSFLDQNHTSLRREKSAMDELIREFLIDPLVAAAEGMVFKELVDRVTGLISRKKAEARQALNRLRGMSVEDRNTFVETLDPDVKAALAHVATGPDVASALFGAIEGLRGQNLDYNQMAAIASSAFELADRLHRHAPAASRQEIAVGNYSVSFRNFRSEAADLRDKYLMRGVVDHEQLNSLAHRLTLSLKHFSEEVTKDFGRESPEGT
jgi:hypothetical protein